MICNTLYLQKSFIHRFKRSIKLWDAILSLKFLICKSQSHKWRMIYLCAYLVMLLQILLETKIVIWIWIIIFSLGIRCTSRKASELVSGDLLVLYLWKVYKIESDSSKDMNLIDCSHEYMKVAIVGFVNIHNDGLVGINSFIFVIAKCWRWVSITLC